MANRARPRVIILGAGFGGLFAARTLADQPVEVLLIDRRNFHLFTPLLYQVATSALDPSEIAYPIRSIFRRNPNVRPLMGEVTAIHPEERYVVVHAGGQAQREAYDYLIIATGFAPAYFGQDGFRRFSFELARLSDAVRLRNHILKLFEQAAWIEDPDLLEAMTTIVIVGGGATGLETAGALHELYNIILDQEYWHRKGMRTRVVLVEARPYLLEPFPESLRRSALDQLRTLGVEVILQNPVVEVRPGSVRLSDGASIPTRTLVWAAGIEASPAARMLGVAPAEAGAVPVEPTLEVAGYDGVYAVGDTAYLENPQGHPYPKLIPVAQQQGILAANNLLRRIRGQPQEPFHYHDRGIMATIGRRRAVAWIYNRLALSGYLAWVAWLGLHLITLMGFRNRLNVFVNWVWDYLTYDRSVRIILEEQPRIAWTADGDGETEDVQEVRKAADRDDP